MSSEEDIPDSDLAVQVAKPKLKKPPQEKATRIMLHVHTKGKGVCGVYTREIAETKVAQVNQYSQERKHPLLCEMEEA